MGEKTVDRGTNRALDPHQTGSTMKPIAAYCLGIDDKLINYSTVLEDSPPIKMMLPEEFHAVTETFHFQTNTH